MVHDQPKRTEIASDHRIVQLNIPAKPDLGAVPDSTDLGAWCPLGAKAGLPLLPVSIVKLPSHPVSGRLVHRVSPRGSGIAGGGNERDDVPDAWEGSPVVTNIWGIAPSQTRGAFPVRFRIGQQPDEHATNHRARVHSRLPAAIGPVEIREGNTVRSLVHEPVKRLDELLECFPVRSQGSRPDQPVALGELLP